MSSSDMWKHEGADQQPESGDIGVILIAMHHHTAFLCVANPLGNLNRCGKQLSNPRYTNMSD